MVNPNAFPSVECYYVAYFIDHAPKWELRKSLIEQIGFKVGVDVVKTDSKPKNIIIGKKGEYRMQVTHKDKKLPLAFCAIIENNKRNGKTAATH